MSATREHRNAALVDNEILNIGDAIRRAEERLDDLSGNLPDNADHPKIECGECPYCLHYGEDCAGTHDYELTARRFLAAFRRDFERLTEALDL